MTVIEKEEKRLGRQNAKSKFVLQSLRLLINKHKREREIRIPLCSLIAIRTFSLFCNDIISGAQVIDVRRAFFTRRFMYSLKQFIEDSLA